jgi:hypothetical protein
MVRAEQEIFMLKALMVLLCLAVGLASLSGCHAGVETERGHGANVGVG